MRICHIVESMDKGAVENWLARTYVHSRASFPEQDWTFYCTLPKVGRNTDHLRSLGAKVIHSPVPFGQKRAFLAAMRSFLAANDFEVMHAHHDFLSGFYLWASYGLPIKQRWVQVHNTDEALPTPNRWKHRLLLEPLRQTCLRMANGIVGISNHVLDQFLRHRPRRPNRDLVRYYGVDTTHIELAEYNPGKFRKELQIPTNACILLFLGRMSPLKNPIFVVDVLKATIPNQPNTFAVFAGEGTLTEAVIQRAKEIGVFDRIRMLGWRDDTAYLMKNSDCFVFPRPEIPVEGLGLVVVESQACGLPMLTTPGVSDDAIIDPRMVQRIPLTSSPAEWAQAIGRLLSAKRHCTNNLIACSRFDMDVTTSELISLYRTTECTL